VPKGSDFKLLSELIEAGVDDRPIAGDVWPDTGQERYIPTYDFRVRDPWTAVDGLGGRW
jgi:hypothetical protein